jgi:hypothetical protein
MKTNDLIVIGAVVGGVMLLMPKVTNKVTENIGTSVGTGAANLVTLPVSTFTEKAVENVFIQPQNWASKQRYIPIIDEAALATAKVLGMQDYGVYPENYHGLRLPDGWPLSKIKRMGNPNKWWS